MNLDTDTHIHKKRIRTYTHRYPYVHAYIQISACVSVQLHKHIHARTSGQIDKRTQKLWFIRVYIFEYGLWVYLFISTIYTHKCILRWTLLLAHINILNYQCYQNFLSFFLSIMSVLLSLFHPSRLTNRFMYMCLYNHFTFSLSISLFLALVTLILSTWFFPFSLLNQQSRIEITTSESKKKKYI